MIKLVQDHAEAGGVVTMRPNHQLNGVFGLEFRHVKAVKVMSAKEEFRKLQRYLGFAAPVGPRKRNDPRGRPE